MPVVLSGKQTLVAFMDSYITMGGEDEATDYVEENGEAWTGYIAGEGDSRQGEWCKGRAASQSANG
ncbi:hypothetical protein RFM99_11310 [Mesorhizobium sp. VK4C]|uniref:hypothetical protein n=1 Tax=Mesorhizobium captivum TaxID=3072319 RepID=UPI002A247177|nr:hypothetical protein [Mesorhizobium sp. VK4C]MDX8499010.1 hypothetical protein [Mesorhizobium sp. VK4C]